MTPLPSPPALASCPDATPTPDRAGSTQTSAPPSLQARSLYRFFRAGEEETLALQGVTLAVAPGELVAVAGPSGSGKSTLLACLAGLDEPSGGTVLVAGQRINAQPEQVRTRLRARHVGVLFQSGNLLEHLTVTGNVALAQALGGAADPPRIARLLATLGLTPRAEAYPAQLSGGEAARAGLAVALANDPAVLLADEPSGELDEDTEADLLNLLAARARAGAAVLVASHSPTVLRVADRVVLLADGRIVS